SLPPTLCPPVFPYTTLFRSHFIGDGIDVRVPFPVQLELGRNPELARRHVGVVDAVEADVAHFADAWHGGSPSARVARGVDDEVRSEEHTSELQSRENLVCRL